MKIPKKINILGKTYKIVLVDGFNYAGMCDTAGVIYIQNNQHPEDMAYTLVHEIIHAWQFRIGLNQAVSRETLEIIAEGVSIVLCEMFEIRFKKP